MPFWNLVLRIWCFSLAYSLATAGGAFWHLPLAEATSVAGAHPALAAIDASPQRIRHSGGQSEMSLQFIGWQLAGVGWQLALADAVLVIATRVAFGCR